jgi:RNA polymerase sigma-70 factor (ECF subfamily)
MYNIIASIIFSRVVPYTGHLSQGTGRSARLLPHVINKRGNKDTLIIGAGLTGGKELTKLVSRAMRGDQAAFSQLIEDFSKDILYSASMLLDDSSEAEDVAQEVIMALFKNITGLKSPHAFYRYLQQTIRFICIRYNQRGKGVSTRDLDDVDIDVAAPRSEEPDQMLDHEQQVREVQALLELLPPRQREFLYLYYFRELSYKEIAKIVGVSVNTVGATISQAKANLKKLV